MANRKESCSDITLSVGDVEVTIESVNVDDEFDGEEVFGNNVEPDGYVIHEHTVGGSFEVHGKKEEVNEILFDDDGLPVPATITIEHYGDVEPTRLTDVITTSKGYEASQGDFTTTTYDFFVAS